MTGNAISFVRYCETDMTTIHKQALFFSHQAYGLPPPPQVKMSLKYGCSWKQPEERGCQFQINSLYKSLTKEPDD